MKICPVCQRSYLDDTLKFCLEDGSTLSPYSPPSTNTPATETGKTFKPTLILTLISLVLILFLGGGILILVWMQNGANTITGLNNNQIANSSKGNKTPSPLPSSSAQNINSIGTNLNPNVPRYEKLINSFDDAQLFFDFISGNKGKIIYLDIQATSDIASGETEGDSPFLSLYEDCTEALAQDEKPRGPKCSGTDYSIQKINQPEYLFGFSRETYKLSGFFLVMGVDGPFQGRMGATLKPMNIKEVIK
jgi:flagellar basal body-associated protein FliL